MVGSHNRRLGSFEFQRIRVDGVTGRVVTAIGRGVFQFEQENGFAVGFGGYVAGDFAGLDEVALGLDGEVKGKKSQNEGNDFFHFIFHVIKLGMLTQPDGSLSSASYRPGLSLAGHEDGENISNGLG